MRTQEEKKIQIEVFQHVARKRVHNHEWRSIIAIPNEQLGGGHHAGNMIRQGLAPGFPDIFCFQSNHGFFGLAIEIKTPKGIIKKNQKEWISELREWGYMAEVRRCSNSVIELLEWYLGIK